MIAKACTFLAQLLVEGGQPFVTTNGSVETFIQCCNSLRLLWFEFESPGSVMNRFVAIPTKYQKSEQVILAQCPSYLSSQVFQNVI